MLSLVYCFKPCQPGKQDDSAESLRVLTDRFGTKPHREPVLRRPSCAATGDEHSMVGGLSYAASA